jgi:transcriptional regulator with XRE-family HTH domain
MTLSLKEMLKKIPAQERRLVRKRAGELVSEYLTLRELRRDLNLTQEDLAGTLGIQQENVSRIETRRDLRISSLRGYLEAMGGLIEVAARFPNRPPVVVLGSDNEGNTNRAKITLCPVDYRQVARLGGRAQTRASAPPWM